MRETPRSMRKNAITLRRRTTASRMVAKDEYEDVATLRASVQPLGDSGRRQDRYDEHSRLGERDSWRAYVNQSDVEAAGLASPWSAPGDHARFNGRDYQLRGRPVPQVTAPDGSVIKWSIDMDGIA